MALQVGCVRTSVHACMCVFIYSVFNITATGIGESAFKKSLHTVC